MKKLYFSKDIGEVEAVKALLVQEGYHPFNTQISDHVGFAGADMFYYVQISEEEFESARNFLKEQDYDNILEN